MKAALVASRPKAKATTWLDSNKPDLIIGTTVFVVVIRGAIKILKLGK